MTPIKLKAEAQDRVIAYNNSAAPLGEREDHADFLKIAYAADRQDYLDLFEEYPTREELLDVEAESKIEILQLPALPALPAVVVDALPASTKKNK